MTVPPFVCCACEGVGLVPCPEGGVGECPLCGGSGYACLVADLGPTHSERRRPLLYDPAARLLTLGYGARRQTYAVSEFRPDGEGRAFRLAKQGGETVYACLANPPREFLCDCAGQSYEASERANRRAHYDGRAVYGTYGCRHLDALALLLKGGWLDIPEHVPEAQR